MAIDFACTCGKTLSANEDEVGQTVRCPACAAELRVPGRASHPTKTSGLAIAALVCGMLGLCLPIAGVLGVLLGIFALIQISGGEGRVGGKGLAIGGIAAGTIGLVIFLPLLFFGVQRVRSAANGMVNASNLRQLGIAMHNYHNDYARLPPAAITSQNGEPLLSWRVAMLQYGEPQDQALYRQFRLNEPWDSPHNHTLLDQMPKMFRAHRDAAPGMTHYQAFVGTNTCFEPGKAITLGQLTVQDGTNNTVLLGEAEEAVPWTKPQDMTFDPEGPLPRLSLGAGGRPEGYVLLFADCTTRTAKKNLTPEDLRALIDRRDGKMIAPGVLN